MRFIAHPGAGRGAFRRRWPGVSAALEAAGVVHDVQVTSAAGETAALARQARDHGATIVAAVGGDGTLHEIVNGLLDGHAERDGARPSAEELPILGLVPAGRGSDYARGLGLPDDPRLHAERFRAALDGRPDAVRVVDVGEVRYRSSAMVAGRPVEAAALSADLSGEQRRYFINAAGVGFSPFVAQRTARFPARLGAYLYTAAAVLTIVDWRERRLRLSWDDGRSEEGDFESVELLLGPYEGGGMLVAPGADPGDGQFDVLLLGAVSRVEMLTFAWRVRSGAHLASAAVELRPATGLGIEVVDGRGAVYLQADGELLGRDPMRFRILPGALRVCG